MHEDPRPTLRSTAHPTGGWRAHRLIFLSLFSFCLVADSAVFAQNLSPLPEVITRAKPSTQSDRVLPPSPKEPLSKLLISQWTVDDGLPTNTLMNIHRSAEGYLWIASYSGLARFDGINFEIFDRKTHPQLDTNSFVQFLEEEDGTLWIGTQGSGIWRVRKGRLEPYDTERLGVVAFAIHKSPEHGFWLGMDTGLFRREANRFEPLILPGFGKARIRDVEIEPDGTLWVASEGHGLARVRDGKATWWTMEDGLVSQALTGLIRIDDRWWIGSLDGLSVFENGTIRGIDSLKGIDINRLYADDFGHLWFSTASGLVRFDPKTEVVELVQELGGHSLRALSGIAFDNEGSVWLTSALSGLFQLRRADFETYTQADGLHTARVNTVYETGPGSFLLGLDDGTLQSLKRENGPGKIDDYPILELPEARMRNIFEDSKGRRWISSYAGLLRRQNGEEELLGVHDGLPTNQIRFVFEDSRGLLWIGTRNGGLVLERDDGYRVIGEAQGLPSNFVLSLDEAPDGRLIVGLRGGMAILKPTSDGDPPVEITATYTEQQGLPGAVVFNTFPERDRIWIATDGGLVLLTEEGLQSIDQDDGLPMNTVFDVKPDERGHLWLTSSMGVIRMDRQSVLDHFAARRDGADPDDVPPLALTLFDDRDGLSHRQCTAATPFTRSSDGLLMFPTLGGLSILDPADISHNPVPPPIHIRSMEVDGVEAVSTGEGPLELEAGGRRFNFRFSNLSLQQPQKNRVWFRLEGFDDRWIEAESTRQALYTNLGPGLYRFRVVGTNNDGIANPQGDALAFRLKPRVHETPLFIAGMAIGLLVLLQRIFLWRVRIVRRRNAELEEIVGRQERTDRENRRLISELEAKNQELERFTYTVSHDLKSPLVTIRGFAGALRDDIQAGAPEVIDQDIDLILKASKRMELLLGELLKLTRLGLVSDDPEWLAMTEVAAEAVSLTAGYRLRTGASIEVQEDMPRVYADRSRLTEVLQNLIENALKHGSKGRVPQVHIGCDIIDGKAVFFVRDNGRGLAGRHKEQIFELFKRLHPDDDGTGLGLALAKRTIETHGGEIWAESDGEDLGTTFRFTLGRKPEPEEPATQDGADAAMGTSEGRVHRQRSSAKARLKGDVDESDWG